MGHSDEHNSRADLISTRWWGEEGEESSSPESKRLSEPSNFRLDFPYRMECLVVKTAWPQTSDSISLSLIFLMFKAAQFFNVLSTRPGYAVLDQ
jgi:hypothetical protein